jgi:hypothetical protein
LPQKQDGRRLSYGGAVCAVHFTLDGCRLFCYLPSAVRNSGVTDCPCPFLLLLLY